MRWTVPSNGSKPETKHEADHKKCQDQPTVVLGHTVGGFGLVSPLFSTNRDAPNPQAPRYTADRSGNQKPRRKHYERAGH